MNQNTTYSIGDVIRLTATGWLAKIIGVYPDGITPTCGLLLIAAPERAIVYNCINCMVRSTKGVSFAVTDPCAITGEEILKFLDGDQFERTDIVASNI